MALVLQLRQSKQAFQFPVYWFGTYIMISKYSTMYTTKYSNWKLTKTILIPYYWQSPYSTTNVQFETPRYETRCYYKGMTMLTWFLLWFYLRVLGVFFFIVCMITKTTFMGGFLIIHTRHNSIVFTVSIKFCDNRSKRFLRNIFSQLLESLRKLFRL